MLKKIFQNTKINLICLCVLFLFSLATTKLISGENVSQNFIHKSTSSYIDASHFSSLPFGTQSHWLQPWRAYLETVPVSTFLNGTGLVMNLKNENPELIARMIAKHGIRRARVEIGWGEIDFENEHKFWISESRLRNQLQAFKKYGIRPLILLNAHHGVPTPFKTFARTLALDAKAGSTWIQLRDIRDLRPGYTGLSNVSGYWAAEILITKISENNIVYLSKPLPKDIQAGTSITFTTLKYRPFSPPNTQDYQTTMEGWQTYVGTIAKFVSETLGSTQSPDKGFDLEIWNELTFGSNFLYINKYYDQPLYQYKENEIWDNLVTKTAQYVERHPQDFSGVRLSNGFANTIPWPTSSTQPKRMSAISKHPYASRKNYPKDEYHGTPINALAQVEDKSTFVPPTYSAFFPEYYGTALQAETIVRDMGPFLSKIAGHDHGRYARKINGGVAPTSVWITEVNINPREDNPNITSERALAVKAKTTARYFCFFLNKGITQLFLYNAVGEDKEFGIVKESFSEYATQPNAVYPQNDSPYTSPALITLGHIVAKMSEAVDASLTVPRQLELVSIRDNHNHYQFTSGSTAAHPTLYNRDVFAFLPFQVNARRFVIPYYVMTRDVMQDLVPEEYMITIKGLVADGAIATAYDPINDKSVPVVVEGRDRNSLSLKLTASDYPYLLTIQE